jgi:endonuclease/exonuclease/phosphatase family metal-dependent hydrolase
MHESDNTPNESVISRLYNSNRLRAWLGAATCGLVLNYVVGCAENDYDSKYQTQFASAPYELPYEIYKGYLEGITYNIHNGEDVDGNDNDSRVARRIIKAGADFACLEETPRDSFIKIIDRAITMHGIFDPTEVITNLEFENGLPKIKFMDVRGNAVLLDSARFDADKIHYKSLQLVRPSKKYAERSGTLIDTPDIQFAVVHLEAKNWRIKLRQGKQFKAFLEAERDPAKPLILCGDMNAPLGSTTLKRLSRNGGVVLQCGATMNGKQIDHIIVFLPKDTTDVLDAHCDVLDVKGESDHKRLRAGVSIRPPERSTPSRGEQHAA